MVFSILDLYKRCTDKVEQDAPWILHEREGLWNYELYHCQYGRLYWREECSWLPPPTKYRPVTFVESKDYNKVQEKKTKRTFGNRYRKK